MSSLSLSSKLMPEAQTIPDQSQAMAMPIVSEGRGLLVDSLTYAELCRISNLENRLEKGRAERLLAETKGVSRQTVLRWMKSIRNNQIIKKKRTDDGKRRNLVTKKWDEAFADQLDGEAIYIALQRHIRSLWSSGISGWRAGTDMASAWLVDTTHDALSKAGNEWSKDALQPVCMVGRRLVDDERDYKLIAIADKDAKKFFDKHLPRVQRDRSEYFPMDVVIGDVTPIDIYVDRLDEDGKTRQATYRAISWLDLATNRLYISFYLAAKGKDVTRREVAASFANMVEAWGLPRSLYLDNGSEYKWDSFLDSFIGLSQITGRMNLEMINASNNTAAMAKRQVIEDMLKGHEVVRAQAYNAPAKPIESIFAALNKILAMMPGYVGGDRQKKKTHNVGRAPISFRGDANEFLRQTEVALKFYHNRVQSGALNGISPREAYQQFVDAGWRRTAVDSAVFAWSFADTMTRKVHQGKFQHTPETGCTIYYQHDKLLPISSNVDVRISPLDLSLAFVFRNDEFLCVATPEIAYSFLDTRGAIEKNRRAKVLRQWLNTKKQDCDRIDLVNEMDRHNKQQPDMPNPEIGRKITLNEEQKQMQLAADEAQLAVTNLLNEQPIQPAISQWGIEEDPAVVAWRETLNQNGDDL